MRAPLSKEDQRGQGCLAAPTAHQACGSTAHCGWPEKLRKGGEAYSWKSWEQGSKSKHSLQVSDPQP